MVEAPIVPLQMPQPPEKLAWVAFSGELDDQTVQRFFMLGSAATNNGFTHVHLLFQSAGGHIASGIALYNYLRALPVKLTIYNVGTVSSISAIAFLGASERVVAPSGSFMIHRSWRSPIQITAERAQSVLQSLIIDDNRVEAILRDETALTDEQWAFHKSSDLWIDAKASVSAKIAHSIGLFAPPLGALLSHV